jgi:hypothetical protein
MRKQVIPTLILIFLVQFSFAQTTTVKGSVVDNTDHKNLQNTVISLLRSKDSVLVKFARADKAGKFSMSNLAEGGDQAWNSK